MTEWIGCTVSNDQLAQIDALLVRTGQTRDEWLHSLVQAALSETPHNIRNLTARVARLEQQQDLVKALEIQVNALTQPLQNQFSSTNERYKPTERTTVEGGSATHLLPTPPSLQTPPPSDGPTPAQRGMDSQTLAPQTSEEDLDQPDEILYDFLEPASSSTSSSPSAFSSSDSNPSPEPNIYDAEDEPDEVLYDFLDEDDRPF